MPKARQTTTTRETEPLKCDLPPDEALKRAMLVKVPDYWKAPTKPAKKRNKR